MLPSNLLRVKTFGRSISPVYARFLDKEVRLAEALIKLYSDSVGRKYGYLLEEVEKLERAAETWGLDYRFFRGLNHILSRRLRVEGEKLSVDPFIVRKRVYRLVNELYGGFVLNDEEKMEVLSKVATLMAPIAPYNKTRRVFLKHRVLPRMGENII